MAAPLPAYVPKQMPPGAHYWPVEDYEAAKLEQLLGVQWSSLRIRGFIFEGPKPTCDTCGKTGGFDDFVYTALENGIHSKDFIAEALRARTEAQPHDMVLCSSCGTQWLVSRRWVRRNTWIEGDPDPEYGEDGVSR
ncbi:hypothetical protein DL765_005529 [Monosporascus sp. GIB2]|nr:hypothetical protein DL765_005529 [Monosporascus sp. GIB2]